MVARRSFRQVLRKFSPTLQQRGKVVRRFADKVGLVYFGDIDQHDDDYSPIRGFTSSITHSDVHYAVGTYNGFDIRLVDRFDLIRNVNRRDHEQLWTILEIDLELPHSPHLFLVPTGHEASEYSRLFSTYPHLQPLNTMIFQNRSNEIHGRFQILSKPSHAATIEALLPSPTVVGIAAKFWPHGIELHNGKLYLYITEHRLSEAALEVSLASLLWLGEVFDEELAKID